MKQDGAIINAIEYVDPLNSYPQQKQFHRNGLIASIQLDSETWTNNVMTIHDHADLWVLLDQCPPHQRQQNGRHPDNAWVGLYPSQFWALMGRDHRGVDSGARIRIEATSSAAAKLGVDRLTQIQATLGLAMQAVAAIRGCYRQVPGIEIDQDLSGVFPAPISVGRPRDPAPSRTSPT